MLEACGGSTDCINARQIEWNFVGSLPEVPHLALPQVPQFAWHCRANFPWCATLLTKFGTSPDLDSSRLRGLYAQLHRRPQSLQMALTLGTAI